MLMTLDHFYGGAGELFSFYRIPKALFLESRFQNLSTDAKTLYGILLDRMSLSVKNGWLDEQGRVFIVYTIEDVKRALCCADNKATKLMRELEKIGLIERKRRGLGRPSLVYVKNFSAESSNSRFKNRENHESGGSKTTSQDPAKSRCNKTDENNTEMSETYPFHSEEADRMNKREQLEEYFSQSLEVDTLLRLCPDDAATILMVDSNLQRENILPSERAFAYKMKMEAMKHQGARSDLTSTHDVSKLRSNEKLGAENNQSRETVRRFIRLTYLVSQLLDMVDQKQISLNPAVELSYLNEEQQKAFIEAMDATQNAPSFSQAKKLRKLAEEGHLSSDSAYVIMNEVKKDELDKVVIKNDTLRKYFPENSTPREMQEQIVGLLEKNKSTQLVFANDALKKYFPKGYTPEQMENIVVRLLTQWQKKHQHSEER